LTIKYSHVKLIDWHVFMQTILNRCAILIVIILLITPMFRSFAQAPGYAEILEPGGGEAVYGVFTINGSASHPSFQAYQLSFALSDDPTETWFLLGEPQTNPVIEDGIGLWDTTGITDGDYRLRLEVFLENDQTIVTVIEGVRVRNQTPIETATIAPIAAQVSATPPPPTRTPRPTPLAPIPTDGSIPIRWAFLLGGIMGFIVLGSLGVYLFIRRRARERWGMLQMRQFLRNQTRNQKKRNSS
jgi:hypothetical protein